MPNNIVSLLSDDEDDNEALNKSCYKDNEKIKNPDKDKQDEADLQMTILEDKFGEFRFFIKVLDYKMLGSELFINDKLIEFSMNHWYTHGLKDEDRNRTYIFGTHFYSLLTKPFNQADYHPSLSPSKIRHERVKNWTKNVDIFKKDFIFIPINENFHWLLAVICFPNLSGKVNMKDGTPVNAPDDYTGQLPSIGSTNPKLTEADPNIEDLWLFDSNSTQNYQDKRGVDYETDVNNVMKNRHILVKQPCILLFDSLSGGVLRAQITVTLREWLEQEYIAKYNGVKKDFNPNIIKGSLVKVPQQLNHTDCGLFIIHYFKMFFDRPIVDYTFPIEHLENWFNADEVTKNCQKRKEIHDIIMNMMKDRKSNLPESFKLPTLDFTDPPVTRHNNTFYSQNLQEITHLHEEPNSVVGNIEHEDECSAYIQCSELENGYSNSEPQTVDPNVKLRYDGRERSISDSRRASFIVNDLQEFNSLTKQDKMPSVSRKNKHKQRRNRYSQEIINKPVKSRKRTHKRNKNNNISELEPTNEYLVNEPIQKGIKITIKAIPSACGVKKRYFSQLHIEPPNN